MAAFLRWWFRFALLFLHSLISLPRHVSGTHEGFLSVQYPYVYVVAGKELSLDCTLNGTSFSTSRVSWKHDGRWLHNQTKRSATKVQLVLRNVTRQQKGLYHCSVFNLSGQRPSEGIPKDGNVTVIVGDPISKPICITKGSFPPHVMLIWNIIHVDDYPGAPQFTYTVLYCHKPSPENKFCEIFSVYKQCSDLSVNSSASNAVWLKCNITSLFVKLFPSLYDPSVKTKGRPAIFVRLTLGNVHVQGHYSRKDTGNCSPLLRVRCTRPSNVHLISLKKKTLTLVWEPPNDMGFKVRYVHYFLVLAMDGGHKNQTLDLPKLDDQRYDFTNLHPYTLYHIYIACSISKQYASYTRGDYIGPFSARTVEEEPSDHPRIFQNSISKVENKEYRDVTFKWKLPDKATWNGIITRFVLHYWTVNSSMVDNGHVEVFSSKSNTTGTVTNLLLNETYAITLQMCTRAGCGPTSEVIYIQAEMKAKDVQMGSDVIRSPLSERLKQAVVIVNRKRRRTGETLKTRITYNAGLSSPPGGLRIARRIEKPPKEGNKDVLLITGVILGLALLIIVASITFFLWAKKLRKQRSHVKMKGRLSERVGDLAPNLFDSPNEPSKIEDSGVYDETFAPLLSDKTDYAQIRRPQTDPLPQQTSDHFTADDKDSGSTKV